MKRFHENLHNKESTESLRVKEDIVGNYFRASFDNPIRIKKTSTNIGFLQQQLSLTMIRKISETTVLVVCKTLKN